MKNKLREFDKRSKNFPSGVIVFILLHEKFLLFDRLRAEVFQLNLKYLHVKITNYGVHLRTKIIENKIQFEVQKLDYPCRNLVI